MYRRRRIAVAGSLGVLLAAGVYLPMTLLAPVGEAKATIAEPPAIVLPAPELDLPGYGTAAIGTTDDDALLGSAGDGETLPMASITKVVTALVVLQQKPLDGVDDEGPTIEMGERALEIYDEVLADDGQVAPVESGLRLSEREVLELALVHSANNYAIILADWAFGSQKAFVTAARAWLADEGLDSVTINEPSGLDEDNVATAADLVALGRLALADPVVADIVRDKRITVDGVGTFTNTNALLGEYGVTGIKTGTLDEANLLFSAEYVLGDRTITLVGTILGAEDHDVLDDDVVELLASTEAGFQQVPLVTAGTRFATLTTAWGDTADIVAAQDAAVVAWTGDAVTTAVDMPTVTLADDGDAAGSVVYTVGEQTITVPLVVDGALDDPGPAWRLSHPGLAFGAP
jgi:D-alanyl-D-alanine carboxypeptidase (penicillin-binding protein 5/6)